MSGKRTITPITPAQQQVLDFIVWFTAFKGYPPTQAEIRKQFAWGSTTAAVNHLSALAKKGRVTWEPGKSRTLTVIAP